MTETLQSLKARAYAAREAMNAARLDYLRAQMQVHLMQGHQKDADRITRQIRNLLDTARPRKPKQPKRPKAVRVLGLLAQSATESGRNATAVQTLSDRTPLTINAAAAASE